MTGHTAGKWELRHSQNHRGMLEVVGPALVVTGFTTASLVDEAKARQVEADAKLICAAPTMYQYITRRAQEGCAEAKSILERINDRTSR